MSMLSDFVTAAGPQAQTVIGTEALTITGYSALNGIRNSTRRSRDYQELGMDVEGQFEFVVSASDFAALFPSGGKAAMGLTATLGSQTFKVRAVDEGAFFVTLTLAQPSKAS